MNVLGSQPFSHIMYLGIWEPWNWGVFPFKSLFWLLWQPEIRHVSVPILVPVLMPVRCLVQVPILVPESVLVHFLQPRSRLVQFVILFSSTRSPRGLSIQV